MSHNKFSANVEINYRMIYVFGILIEIDKICFVVFSVFAVIMTIV